MNLAFPLRRGFKPVISPPARRSPATVVKIGCVDERSSALSSPDLSRSFPMRLRLFGASTCLALGLALLVGCSREGPRGGPGANPGGTTDSASTFKVKVPEGTTGITQGENREVTVSVSRGSKFDQEVQVSFKAPPGVEVTPMTATAKKGADDVKVTLHAKADAKVGKEDVVVVGTPHTGTPTSVNMTVEVKQKS
jgi:hypothetical protein